MRWNLKQLFFTYSFIVVELNITFRYIVFFCCFHILEIATKVVLYFQNACLDRISKSWPILILNRKLTTDKDSRRTTVSLYWFDLYNRVKVTLWSNIYYLDLSIFMTLWAKWLIFIHMHLLFHIWDKLSFFSYILQFVLTIFKGLWIEF